MTIVIMVMIARGVLEMLELVLFQNLIPKQIPISILTLQLSPSGMMISLLLLYYKGLLALRMYLLG